MSHAQRCVDGHQLLSSPSPACSSEWSQPCGTHCWHVRHGTQRAVHLQLAPQSGLSRVGPTAGMLGMGLKDS